MSNVIPFPSTKPAAVAPARPPVEHILHDGDFYRPTIYVYGVVQLERLQRGLATVGLTARFDVRADHVIIEEGGSPAA